MNSLARKLLSSSSSSSTIANYTKRLTCLLLHASYSSSSITSTRKSSPTKPQPSSLKTMVWQENVVNTVNLIGQVKIPVQYKTWDDKLYAATIITQESPTFSPDFWIRLNFDGDLAHNAVDHLKVDECIHVTGQLTADPPPFPLNHHHEAYLQVLVKSLYYVQEPTVAERKKARLQKIRDGGISIGVKNESSWEDLVSNPREWNDCRKLKMSGLLKPSYPDFRRVDGHDQLWLTKKVPSWVLSRLKEIEGSDVNFQQPSDKNLKTRQVKKEPNVKIPQSKQVKEGGEDAKWVQMLWNHLLENPLDWLDHRTSKSNIEDPDFKHKDSGEPLWLSTSPSWVLPKLLQMSGLMKPSYPDFKRVDGNDQLWLKSKVPSLVQSSRLEEKDGSNVKFQQPDVKNLKTKQVRDNPDVKIPQTNQVKEGNEDAKWVEMTWNHLLENPSDWLDHRTSKSNVEDPDFKHKLTGEPLWLSTSPSWVLPKLPPPAKP